MYVYFVCMYVYMISMAMDLKIDTGSVNDTMAIAIE